MAHTPGETLPPWLAYPYVLLQYLLPHHLLSALMYRLTRSQWAPLKDLLIRQAMAWYGVTLEEAMEQDPKAYASFNAFFTRALRPEARPLAEAPEDLLCPCDGTLSQCGPIWEGHLFQAKGHHYHLSDLLGGDQAWTERFQDGQFATLYLSPRDYHRVHMPLTGELREMRHVPGRLFSVNPTTTHWVPRLFARNERVICLFETPAGPMALILVGAIFVASIDTVWAGTVTPRSRRRHDATGGSGPVGLERGAEMGRFNMGSTVILLFPPGRVAWDPSLQPGVRLRMGQRIGRTLSAR